MRIVDLILKKRRKEELSEKEINYIIDGYVSGKIPDYQISALLMTIYFNGMTETETAALTMAMVNSGETVDLSSINGIKVDKHSTGGVGDTTTLVLAPLVAAAGVPVAKMSGRGLGHTGGTIDKLESIKGFNVNLNREEFIKAVNKNGIAVVGQSKNLVPADAKLYALRDVTATVESIPLIASSIMSKKIASGADAIVLDVKTGSGAFMKTVEDSFKLAEEMVKIGNNVGRNTIALITDMDQPLGMAIGNALEVKEAIEVLENKVQGPLREVSVMLGSYMLLLAKAAKTYEEAKKIIISHIEDGTALEKLKQMIKEQGGDETVVDNAEKLPKAQYLIDIKSDICGYVSVIQAEKIGRSAMILGAGRETKESTIDLATGMILNKRVGDRVEKGEILAEFHVNDKSKIDEAERLLKEAYIISDEYKKPNPLVYGVVSKEGIQRL